MKKLLSITILLALVLTMLVGCKPEEDKSYLYNDFTPTEKEILKEYLGTEIPFMANDGYYLFGLTEVDDYNHGLRYIVKDVTADEVSEYKSLLSMFGELQTVTENGVTVTRIDGTDIVLDIFAYLNESGSLTLELKMTSKTLSEPIESEVGDPDPDPDPDPAPDPDPDPDPDPNPDPDPDPDPEPDPEPTEVGYYVSCRNSSDLLYFTGNVTDGRFDGSTSKSDAVLVFIEEVTGGYNLYFNRGDTKTYFTVDDNSRGAGLTATKSAASVFEWDSTLKTMKVVEDSNNRALGMKTDSTYTSFSTYDAQNTSYNYASFKTASGVEFTPGNGGSGNGGGNDSGGGNNSGNGGSSTHTYTDFTTTEKGYFTQYLGKVLPFVANDEYYLDDYYGTDNYAYGFNFYTYGNTAAEFAAYKNAIVAAGFELDDQYTDDYGDTWYTYYDGDIVIDVSYYEYEGEYVIDLYAYSLTLSEEDDGSGDNGGSSGGGSSDSSDPSTPDVDLITNDGKGLPTDTNSDGVVDVNLKDADKIKDVTDQGYYLDGCPTTGNPGVLVIPVEFSDVTAASKGYTIDKIVAAFNGASGSTDYYSVDEYYKISSYGQLDLNITVLDTWYRAQNRSSYYLSYTMDYYGTDIEAGDMLLINEILDYLDDFMDLSQFDSDGNGTIDAIVIINTLDIDSDVTMQWAYRYWNVYTDDDGYYYEYDGVSANDYLWASYAFMYETTDNNGNTEFTDTSALNTYTYIHEFGHILGADDYYDTSGESSPMDGCDVMDSMLGDHNAFTKFNYGWITDSRLVVTDSSVTLTLEDFTETGDTIIIANNWDATLGAYQEYFIVVYYTNNGLNGGDLAGYFSRDGIVVYRINSSLYAETLEGTTYYDIYNNNTSPSDEYGTEDNLIEFVKSANDTFTYVAGDTLPTVTLTSGDSLIYTFVVDSIDADSATITFSKTA